MNINRPIPLHNLFEQKTKGNYSKMLVVAANYTAFLKNNRLKNKNILPHYNTYWTICSRFNNLMLLTATAKENRKTYTAILATLFKDLSGKWIDEWDIKIRYHLKRSSLEYAFLIPDGRAPFQKGSYDNRIKAVIGLIEKLALFPTLDFLLIALKNWIDKVTEFRSLQKKYNALYNDYLSKIEPCRQALAQEMQLILVHLVNQNYINAAIISSFLSHKNVSIPAKNSGAMLKKDRYPICKSLELSGAFLYEIKSRSFLSKGAFIAQKQPIYTLNELNKLQNNTKYNIQKISLRTKKCTKISESQYKKRSLCLNST